MSNTIHLASVTLLLAVSSLSADTHYVSVQSTNATPPYTNWATAAQAIQQAVDVAQAGEEILVADGNYATASRVTVNKSLTVRSVNGPQATRIDGYNSGPYSGFGCVYLTNGATLIGFTLANARGVGRAAGVYCESTSAVLSNCVLSGNSLVGGIIYPYTYGGGAYGGTLYNCTLSGNYASGHFRAYGGGACNCTLNNCTLSGNGASGESEGGYGGGAYNCTLNNCTLSGNDVYGYGGGAANCILNNCTLTANRAYSIPYYAIDCSGGGAASSTLNNCTLTSNSAVGRGTSGSSGGGASGCTLSNCVLTGNSALPADLGGESSGGGASGGTLYNCTLSGNSAPFGGGARFGTLYNCVLTANTATSQEGGGAFYSTLLNCTVTGNWAATTGGGASGGTLHNCTLSGNFAQRGGGTVYSTLFNCTVTGNRAGTNGGGAYGASLNNCIVYYNDAPQGTNYYYGVLSYCCTTPAPTNGVGNITNPPLFVDYASGNLRLQSNSPCINAGDNTDAPGPTDLDGNPRIVGGYVDIGAYECQSPALLDYFIWLQNYGLSTYAGALYADSDGDGMNNWQEWRCGTSPIDRRSALRLLSASSDGTGATVRWASVEGVSYFLERSTNLTATPAFTLLATNILGLPGTTTFTDTNAVGLVPLFYRVGVAN